WTQVEIADLQAIEAVPNATGSVSPPHSWQTIIDNLTAALPGTQGVNLTLLQQIVNIAKLAAKLPFQTDLVPRVFTQYDARPLPTMPPLLQAFLNFLPPNVSIVSDVGAMIEGVLHFHQALEPGFY